jgi:hypothetical protein
MCKHCSATILDVKMPYEEKLHMEPVSTPMAAFDFRIFCRQGAPTRANNIIKNLERYLFADRSYDELNERVDFQRKRQNGGPRREL